MADDDSNDVSSGGIETKASRAAIVDDWWKTLPRGFPEPNGLLMFGNYCAFFCRFLGIANLASVCRLHTEIVGFTTLMQKMAHLLVAGTAKSSTTASGIGL